MVVVQCILLTRERNTYSRCIGLSTSRFVIFDTSRGDLGGGYNSCKVTGNGGSGGSGCTRDGRSWLSCGGCVASLGAPSAFQFFLFCSFCSFSSLSGYSGYSEYSGAFVW